MEKEKQILRLRDVLKLTGMGRSWTYEAIRRGDFPSPVKLGARAVGWRRSDIEAWLSNLHQK